MWILHLIMFLLVIWGLLLFIDKDPKKPVPKSWADVEILNRYTIFAILLWVFVLGFYWFRESMTPAILFDKQTAERFEGKNDVMQASYVVGNEPKQVRFSGDDLKAMNDHLQNVIVSSHPGITGLRFEPHNVHYVVEDYYLAKGWDGLRPRLHSLTSITEGTATFTEKGKEVSRTEKVGARHYYTQEELIRVMAKKGLLKDLAKYGLEDEFMIPGDSTPHGSVVPDNAVTPPTDPSATTSPATVPTSATATPVSPSTPSSTAAPATSSGAATTSPTPTGMGP